MIIVDKKIIQELLNKSIEEFKQKKDFEINSITDLDILDYSKENGIVYIIFSDEEIKYIGKSKGKYFKNRLKNHLIKKDIKAKSKLSFVQNEKLQNKKITIKFIEVSPDSIRNLIEELLIEKFKKENIWNNK